MQLLVMKIRDVILSTSYGNSALKTLIDTLDTVADAIYARLGAPAGASMSADTAAIKAETALILAEVDGALLAANVKCYPTLAAAVTVTGAAGVFTLGNFATIVAAAAIATDFYVNTIYVTAVSGAQISEIVLYHGAGDTEFARIIYTGSNGIAIKLSAFKKIPAGDQIRAKLASAAGGAQTANIILGYHL